MSLKKTASYMLSRNPHSFSFSFTFFVYREPHPASYSNSMQGHLVTKEDTANNYIITSTHYTIL